jgi:hypothetical protein
VKEKKKLSDGSWRTSLELYGSENINIFLY